MNEPTPETGQKAKKSWPEPLFKFFGVLILVLSIGGGWLLMDYRGALDLPLNVPDAGLAITVQPGQSLHGLADALSRQGVLHKPWYLVLHGRLAGKAGKIKAGEYALSRGVTPRSLLQMLVAGKVTQYSFTIVEGWTFRQLRAALSQHDALQHTLADKTDAEVMTALGRADTHPEGQFLPDTYLFPRGTTDLAFLLRAHGAMQRALAQAWAERAEELPYQSPAEALIMASIIEKETGVAGERAEIAGVFVRRLQKGMRLQTDPTIIYGLGDTFDGDLTRQHLNAVENAYNTYQHDGLPPTPIAMPGKAALHAALHPAPGDSLFFVARGDGSHQFSATLKEHNRAVAEFQLRNKRPNTAADAGAEPDKAQAAAESSREESPRAP